MENLPNDLKLKILDEVEESKRGDALRENHTRQVRDNLIRDQEQHMDILMNEYNFAQLGFEPDMQTVYEERIAVERLARRIDQVQNLVRPNVNPEEYVNTANEIANMNTLILAQENLHAMRQRLAQRQQRDMQEFLRHGIIF